MAAAVSPLLLRADANPSAATPEAEGSARVTNREANASPQPGEYETLAPEPPPFINSIAELKGLSDAIYSFQKRFDDLRNHLDNIKVAIVTLLPQGAPEVAVPAAAAAADSSPPNPSASEGKVVQYKSEGIVAKSELESLCKTMCSRGVRKYLATNLSDLPKLREEVPQALKLAPDPPKLVLECLGKFFLQGSKAYTKDSPMIPAREASILILECFLLMLGMVGINEKENWTLNIEKSLRDEAEAAAQAWRKRLGIEGGLAKANQIDARGLLLFVACFGLPASFKKEDIRDLVIAANAKEIVCVLQNSSILMAKIPEMVEAMIKNKMEVDAVDIVYTFGLVEQFNPQTILTSFLRLYKDKESTKKPKKGLQVSAAANNEVTKKHLVALKSVAVCLERHKIDHAEVIPGWQINEKIASLEKEVAEFNQKSGEKTAQKRKVGEMETPKKPKFQETKRSRFATRGPQQQKATGHIDVRRNTLNSGLPNHVKPYATAPSVVYGGPGTGLVPESIIPPGFGAGPSGNHGGVQVDAVGHLINRGTHPYIWHGDSAINYASNQASSMPPTVLYRQSQPIEGFAGMPNSSSVGSGSRGTASDLYHFADTVADKSESHLMSLPRAAGTLPTSLPPHLYQS